MDSNNISPDMIKYFQEVAEQSVGDAHIMVECSYCHAPVEVWEALLVANLFVGVPAHMSCSFDAFFKAMEQSQMGPKPSFDYLGFSHKIDEMMEDMSLPDNVVSGILEIEK